MILKLFHLIGIVVRYIICHILLLLHRYDKKYCTSNYFNRINSKGWDWLFHDWLSCVINGSNSSVPWPVNASNTVAGWENICFHPDDLHNFQGKGCYFQAVGKMTIGKGSFIANNVGIITSNHDVNNIKKHVEAKPVIIGECCWVGMNSVILPGVELGPHTIVGAGSIVTHSFPAGYCIIAGNPAKVIKQIINPTEVTNKE